MIKKVSKFTTVISSEPDDLFNLEFSDESDVCFLALSLSTGPMRFKLWLGSKYPIEFSDVFLRDALEYGKGVLTETVSRMNPIDLEAPIFKEKGPRLILHSAGGIRTVSTEDGLEVFSLCNTGSGYVWTLMPNKGLLIDYEEFEQLVTTIKTQI